ncbi:unnamed protein product, partial [Iphiclides podalirius]
MNFCRWEFEFFYLDIRRYYSPNAAFVGVVLIARTGCRYWLIGFLIEIEARRLRLAAAVHFMTIVHVVNIKNDKLMRFYNRFEWAPASLYFAVVQ